MLLLLWHLLLLLGSEGDSHAGYVHDLGIRVRCLPPPLLLLADEGLEDGHHLRVVKDAWLTSSSLPLRGEQDHQSSLSARVDALLLLLLLLLNTWAGRGSGCCCWAWTTLCLGRRRSSCLDCGDLSLDDVLQVLRD